MATRHFRVVLDIWVDESLDNETPSGWNWRDLLAIEEGESVILISCEETVESLTVPNPLPFRMKK